MTRRSKCMDESDGGRCPHSLYIEPGEVTLCTNRRRGRPWYSSDRGMRRIDDCETLPALWSASPGRTYPRLRLGKGNFKRSPYLGIDPLYSRRKRDRHRPVNPATAPNPKREVSTRMGFGNPTNPDIPEGSFSSRFATQFLLCNLGTVRRSFATNSEGQSFWNPAHRPESTAPRSHLPIPGFRRITNTVPDSQQLLPEKGGGSIRASK